MPDDPAHLLWPAAAAFAALAVLAGWPDHAGAGAATSTGPAGCRGSRSWCWR